MIKEIAVKEADPDKECVALEKVFKDYFRIESNLLDLEYKLKAMIEDKETE